VLNPNCVEVGRVVWSSTYLDLSYLSKQQTSSTMSSKNIGNFSAKTAGFAVTTLALSLLSTVPAQASTFTRGTLPTAVSEVGGIVLDLIGANGTRVVTQLAASTLFTGFATANPFTIGTQSGFSPTVVAALGGGISQASVRVSLLDGDTAAGNFDFNDNTLLLNGINFGNFSTIQAQNTTETGAEGGLGFSGGGFRDDTLDTGFFTSSDTTTLASLFGSLGSGNVVFGLNDLDPRDNFYDFTQGIDSSLINVGTGPVVTPPSSQQVPEPFTIIGTLMGSASAFRMRKRLKATNKL
jgi:hypothetical protein